MTDSRETERAELHKTIWRIANDLRGSVDGWDFKTYVLGMLFYRFISENLASYLDRQERNSGQKDFDYAALSDKQAKLGREEAVKEKGFYILPSHLFANVRKRARQDPNLNETLSKVFKGIEASARGTERRPTTNDVKPSLKAVLKRLKLSGLVPVLPDRTAYASKAKLPALRSRSRPRPDRRPSAPTHALERTSRGRTGRERTRSPLDDRVSWTAG